LTVINDILDFSKIEAHKLTLENISFDIRKNLTTALDIHRLQAREKGLSLKTYMAEDIPETLEGDPSRLRQVLVNLVSNAIKFTESGEVSVTATLANGPTNPRKGDEVTVEFAVSDTGIGIPGDKQQAIFQSFLQADESITRKHGGTGLGLAICKLLVEMMHGRIRLKSKEGKGSTFSFTARLKVGDPAAISDKDNDKAKAEIADIPRLKVLLADDNPLNRELAATLLTEQGHETVAVENGVQVLEAVKKDSFDIVLMDVQMPIMDGITATRAIRDPNSGALEPTIPIVALTAHALKGDRERFLEAGMDDYIAKPIKIRDFLATIANAVSGKTPARTLALPDEQKGDVLALPFDRESALDMLGQREDLLARMDEIFLRDVPLELEELASTIANHEWEKARRMAHSIKGSSRTVGAQRAGAIAEQLEFLCKQKDAPSADRELKTLESEVKLALQYIKDALRKKQESNTSTQGAH